MTVQDLITELQRLVDAKPEVGGADVYIARESEAAPLYSDDISVTDQIQDADDGEIREGLFLELTTWS